MAQMSAGGSVVAFEVSGGKPAAFRFLNRLRLIDISNNLGDAKSLICHPATTTHQRLTPEDRATVGITDGFVRLSVGLESADDLIADLKHALAAERPVSRRRVIRETYSCRVREPAPATRRRAPARLVPPLRRTPSWGTSADESRAA